MKVKKPKTPWMRHVDSKYKNKDQYITIPKVIVRNGVGGEIIRVIPARKQKIKRSKPRRTRIFYSSFSRA